ncbi:hypothetical protein, partial [Deinococcus pimensis]|uniref:hypothetical protein n=1 Tax=Deinococcus pimensis TaxID=309888 RepID=UPI0005EAE7C0
MTHLIRDPDDPALSARLDDLLSAAARRLESRPAESLAFACEAADLARDLDDDGRLSTALRL